MIDWHRVWFVTKTRQDNDVIEGTSAVYAENDNELSWPMGLGVIYDKNKGGQWCDRLYRYYLCQKRYWTFMTDRI